MVEYFLELNKGNISMLNQFLSNAYDIQNSFRYYSVRPTSVIEDHLYTVLLITNKEPVGYGHLDPENSTVWLG